MTRISDDYRPVRLQKIRANAMGRPTSAPSLRGRITTRRRSFVPKSSFVKPATRKGLRLGAVPPVCVLDPDGNVVRNVRRMKRAQRSRHWACYHTEMSEWDEHGQRLGIVGCAVGASFAILVAEQLFVSGCELLIGVGSAGQIADLGPPRYYIVVDRAVRDEGTSYPCLPPDRFVDADRALLALADEVLVGTSGRLHRGTTRTTDAPFRETANASAKRRRDGVLAVEMEAAALYAFGLARNQPVLCVTYVTNRLGCVEGDFEKGDYNGAPSSLSLIRALSERRRASERRGCPARGPAIS